MVVLYVQMAKKILVRFEYGVREAQVQSTRLLTSTAGICPEQKQSKICASV